MKLDKQSYWKWAHSDLISNAERGVVAEYIVATATQSLSNSRVEWGVFDVETPDGIKIEVKASGYVQTWDQSKPSTIRFGVGKTKSWNAKKNEFDDFFDRSSDVYVFCVHAEKKRDIVDPLNTDQWLFYVLSTNRINSELGDQKSDLRHTPQQLTGTIS